MNTQIKTITEILLLALPILLVSFGANALDFEGDSIEPNFESFPLKSESNLGSGVLPAPLRSIGSIEIAEELGDDFARFANEGGRCAGTLVGNHGSNTEIQVLTALHCIVGVREKDGAKVVLDQAKLMIPNPKYRSNNSSEPRFKTFVVRPPEHLVGKEILPAGVDLNDLNVKEHENYTMSDRVLLSFSPEDSAEATAFADSVGYMGLAFANRAETQWWKGYTGTIEGELESSGHLRDLRGQSFCGKTYETVKIGRDQITITNPVDLLKLLDQHGFMFGSEDLAELRQHLCAAGYKFNGNVQDRGELMGFEKWDLRVQNNCGVGYKESTLGYSNCWASAGMSGGPLFFRHPESGYVAVGVIAGGIGARGTKVGDEFKFGVNGHNLVVLVDDGLLPVQLAPAAPDDRREHQGRP